MPVTLCFIKDKHKVMEHKILLETYFAGLLQKVEWQIQEYEDTAADTLTLCRLCVDYLQEILGELKTFIISYPFASTEEEIHFFKELKPLLASKIIYYNTVYKIEVRFPSGSEDVQRDYLLSETDRISKSFQRNLAFYQYHRTKATYLDRQYFMRGKPDIQIIVDSFYYETDPQFSTSHDFKVAKILANELLEIYLTNRLHELERREQRKRMKNGFTGKVLRWTGTKRALVELVYALDACGCLNKGTVDIKEIDSVKCDFDQYPYKVNTYARQLIVRESSLTVRSLVTSCRLLNATRSDNNPHGFIIEAFTITENKDLQTVKR